MKGTSFGSKCDYLLTKYDSSPFGEYFVELKGSDVSYGITQLEETIKQLSVRNGEQMEKRAFVVASSVSPKIRTNIQNAKVRFLNEKHTGLYLFLIIAVWPHSIVLHLPQTNYWRSMKNLVLQLFSSVMS